MPKDFIEDRYNNIFNETLSYDKQYFAKYLDIAKEVYMEKYNRPLPKWGELNIIRALKNTEKDLVGQFGKDVVRKAITESTTTPSDVGKFIHYSFGFATAMLADSILDKFTSVQTMDKRVGEVFYMNIVKGSSKGAFHTAGTSYIDALEGPKMLGGNYTSEKVEVEEWGVGDGEEVTFTTTLVYKPVVPNNFEVYYTIDGTLYVAKDNGSGGITGTNITTGSINYETGAVSIEFSYVIDDGAKIFSNYYYNSALENGMVTDLTAKLVSIFLTAGRRVTNLKYLFDASLMLNKEHGIDLEAELIEKGVNGIMNEIAIDCINQIYRNAVGGSDEVIFSKTPPSTQIPYIIHRQEILGKIADGDLKIQNNIRYAKTGTIIGGREFVSLCKGLPNDVFQKTEYKTTPVGPHIAGVLDGQYEVIQCLDMVENGQRIDDRFVLVAKGDDNLLTGSIFAEFIPLTVLNPIWNQSLDVFRSVVSYQAFKIVNNKFFLKGKITA